MRLLLVISGSIAAYKSLELIRLFKKSGADVTAILTKGGAEFITPLAVSSLTGTQTYHELFSLKDEVEMGHIRLSREVDAIVIAPASADLIAKMVHGLADDLASATLLAANVPIFVAPAMNQQMWHNRATQRNLRQLVEDGRILIEPGTGEMACGEEGTGRMAEPEIIAEKVLRGVIPKTLSLPRPGGHTTAALSGKRALVTSGPTYEPIDPVRFLGNLSSGKQGHAIAAALQQAGADVTLITGPTHLPDPEGVSIIRVNTAEQMYDAVEEQLPVDIAVCAAAVADWTPEKVAESKIKKRQNNSAPSLKLRETKDILAGLSQRKKNRPTLVIGFAAETDNMLTHAKNKFVSKQCDWLFANDVSGGAIFGADATKLSLITGKGISDWPPMSKTRAAERMTTEITAWFAERKPQTNRSKTK